MSIWLGADAGFLTVSPQVT